MAFNPLQQNHRYSVFFAPRGSNRMAQLGMQLAQLHLSPFDRLIGVVGEAGSGKSLLIKGMFPGLELSNDDQGVNVRPLPILDLENCGFYANHTYHLDVRFESAFTQIYELADAVLEALMLGKRVVVEHFEMLYPFLNKHNADLLISVGAEIIITRPTVFGPKPDEMAKIAFDTIKYRKMAHTAEDLVEYLLLDQTDEEYTHDDVYDGFVLRYRKEPKIDLVLLDKQMKDLIAKNLPISYVDEHHIRIADYLHFCTGPRIHVSTTGEIEKFVLLDHILHDKFENSYLLVGLVGRSTPIIDDDLNRIIV